MRVFATFSLRAVNPKIHSGEPLTGLTPNGEISCQRYFSLLHSHHRRSSMRRIICLFVLLALAAGVHADDKKKKKPAANNVPVKVPGGGGGAGPIHMPNMSHGNPSHSLNQTNRTLGAPHTGGPSATNPLSTHATTASGKTGHVGATGQSSNPLLRKGGQAGANGQSSNPLTHGNQHAGATLGQKRANPMAPNHAGQPGMNGHTGAHNLAAKNNANFHNGHAVGAQYGRGLNSHPGNWHAAHANYRVQPYREVFHNYHAVRHDRYWYNNHYDRVVVMGGGYYYWNAGYWYPAWGYDPAVSFYVYDGPIYSYDNLPPDQVTMNVQAELQDEGYYTGEIDGQVGPKTRGAIGTYQADHNLEVTSAIDEPTVEALGLTGTS
jgi:hypothetical protein